MLAAALARPPSSEAEISRQSAEDAELQSVLEGQLTHRSVGSQTEPDATATECLTVPQPPHHHCSQSLLELRFMSSAAAASPSTACQMHHFAVGFCDGFLSQTSAFGRHCMLSALNTLNMCTRMQVSQCPGMHICSACSRKASVEVQ